MPPNQHSTHPGQSTVEFALVVGILLMLLLGSVSAMQLLLANYQVAQAARAAAHAAALAGGPAQAVIDTGNLVLDSGIVTNSSLATITATCPDGCGRYRPIDVRVQYEVELWVPLPFVGSRYTIDHQATRASEKDYQP